MQSTLTVPDESRAAWPVRLRTILVAAIWLATMLAQLGVIIYLLPVRRYTQPAGLSALLYASDLSSLAFNLLLATLGAIIVLRAANRRIGWILVAAGSSLAVGSFASQYSQYALRVVPQAALPLVSLAAWLQDLWTIPVVLLFLLLPVLFPDGKLPSPRWHLAFWPVLAGWLLFILVFAFARRPLANEFLELEPGARHLTHTAFFR